MFGGFMKKVRYIFGRIKNMNFKNMFKTIDKIHTLSGKSKVFIFFDMIICALRYQSGQVDYLLFEMWRLNAKERKTVLLLNSQMVKKQKYPL